MAARKKEKYMKRKRELKSALSIALSVTLVAGSLTIFPLNFARASEPVKALKDSEGNDYLATYTGSKITPPVTVFDSVTEDGATTEYVISSDASEKEYTVEYGENINAGIGTVTVKNNTGKSGGDYAIQAVTYQFTIDPKQVESPAIVLSQSSFTYNGSSQTPVVTVKDGSAVIPDTEYTVTYKNLYDNTIDTTNAGTIEVTITDAKTGSSTPGENGNYEIKTTTTSYAITRSENTLSLGSSSGSVSYLGDLSVPISENISGGELSALIEDGTIAEVSIGDNEEGSGKVLNIHATKVGNTKISVSSAETRNFNGSSASDFTLTVTPAGMTVNATNGEGIYSGDAQILGEVSVTGPTTYEITYSDPYTAETISPVYEKADKPAITDAGTYYVYYKVSADNYEDYKGSYTVNIGRLNTATAQARTGLIYTGEEQLGVTAQYVTLTNEKATEAGSHTATATPDKNHAWSDGTFASKDIEFTIARADNSFSLSEMQGSVTYKETAIFTLSGNISGGAYSVRSSNENIAKATLNGNTVTVQGTGVGETTIVITTEATDNYDSKELSYTVTVTKASLTDVTSQNGESDYTGTVQKLGSVSVGDKKPDGTSEPYVISYSDPLIEAPDAISYSNNEKPGVKDVGAYTVYYKITSDNYNDYTGSYTVKINRINNAIEIDQVEDKVYTDADFTVSLKNEGYEESTVTWSVDSGNATINSTTGQVHITGIGDVTIRATKAETTNYKSCYDTMRFTVVSAPINAANIKISESVTPGSYNGSVLKPVITVRDTTFEETDSRSNVLTEGVDYTVNYPSDMISAGEKTYTITGKGNYTGTSVEKTYTISPLDITNAMLAPETASFIYNSKSFTPELSTISAADSEGNPMVFEFENLTKGTDYTIRYTKPTEGIEEEWLEGAPVNVGSYKLYVIGTGNGNISGTTNPINFNISQRDIGDGTVTVAFTPNEYVYNGTVQEKTPTVTWVSSSEGVSKTLVKDTDYTIELTGDLTNVTEDGVMAKAAGTGNFTGFAEGTYKITPYTVSVAGDTNVFIEETDTPIYTDGSGINFEDHIVITSKLGGNHALVKDTDYTVEKTDAKDPDKDGVVTMLVRFKGNYKDEGIGHTYTAPVSFRSTTGAVFSFDSETKTLTVSGGTGNIDDDIVNRIRATGATKIVIGDNAGKITKAAFRGEGSENIEDITATEGSGYKASSGVLMSADGKKILAALPSIAGEYVIPEGVTGIGEEAFKDCTLLTSVIFPTSVKNIGKSAFEDCSSLASADISGLAGVTVGQNAFKGTKLVSVTIPEGSTVAQGAYLSVSTLRDITIENATISEGAFTGSSANLNTVTINGSSVIENNALGGRLTAGTLTINGNPTIGAGEAGTIDPAFLSENSFNNILISNNDNIETMPNGEVAGAFLVAKSGNEKTLVKVLKPAVNITIPDGITKIGSSVFKDDGVIKTATLPSSVKEIGTSAFEDSTLESIDIPENGNLEVIGDRAFKGTRLSQITFPVTLKEIGKSAFEGISLTEVTIPEGVTAIGSKAFKDTSLNSIVIPLTINDIGTDVFSGTQIKEITIPEGVPFLEETFGDSWTKLTTIGAEEKTVVTRNVVDNGDGTLTTITTSETLDPATNAYIRSRKVEKTVRTSDDATIKTATTNGERTDEGGKKLVTTSEEIIPNGKKLTTRTVILDADGNIISIIETIVIETEEIIDGNTVKTVTTIENEGTNEDNIRLKRSTKVETARDANGALIYELTVISELDDNGNYITTSTSVEPCDPSEGVGEVITVEKTVKDANGKEISFKKTVNSTKTLNGVRTESSVETIYTTTQDITGADVRKGQSKTEVIKVTAPTDNGYSVTTTTNIYDPNDLVTIIETHTETIYYDRDGNIVKTKIAETDVDGSIASKFGHLVVEDISDSDGWDETYLLSATTVELPDNDKEVIADTVKSSNYSVLDIKFTDNDAPVEMPESRYRVMMKYPSDWPAPATVNPKFYWYDDTTSTMEERPAEFVTKEDEIYIAGEVNHFSYYVVSYTAKPKIKEYTITYKDGVDDAVIFLDQVFTVQADSDTPGFVGTPSRTGYKFTGWSPSVTSKVTKDEVYKALWEKDSSSSGDSTPVTRYTITYTDGVDGTVVFSDQVFKAEEGSDTPKFIGTPSRIGYKFIGWSPAVTGKVTKDEVYKALWEAIRNDDPAKGTLITRHTITYTDGVDGVETFSDQVYNVRHGSDTPAFLGTPSREGWEFSGWTPIVEKKVTKDITYAALWKKAEEKPKEPKSEDPEEKKPEESLLIKLFRVFNPFGYHLFTVDANERDYLVSLGWRDEGTAFSTTSKAKIPVYRVYNPNNGDHLFTTSVREMEYIVSLGWIYEGVAFRAPSEGKPVYRLYNPYTGGEHFYTRSGFERYFLIGIGWRNEGIAFYMKE